MPRPQLLPSVFAQLMTELIPFVNAAGKRMGAPMHAPGI